jgi:hypothetical protein
LATAGARLFDARPSPAASSQNWLGIGLLAAHEVVAGTGIFADPSAHERLFELDVEGADGAVWENVGQPGTRPIRRSWRSG